MGKDTPHISPAAEATEQAELAVDLALSATAPADATGPCLDAETLASLADGTLSDNEREQVLVHLDSCPECRAQWVLVASVPDMPTAQPAPQPARTRSFAKLAAMGGLIAACLLCAIYFGRLYTTQPDYIAGVDAGYAMVLADASQALSAQRLAATASARTDRGEPSATPSPFREGIESGAKTLQQGEPGRIQDTASAHTGFVTHLGRWHLLLEVALGLEPGPDARFWQEQAATARAFRQQHAALYTHEEQARTGPLFASLEQLLAAMGQAPTPSVRADLHRKLRGLEIAAQSL